MSNVLRIKAADVTAEITVFDGSFGRIATGVNELESKLPTGIYKVRVQVGSTLRERMVSLDADRTLEFGAAGISSPVPLQGTSETRQLHVEAAVHASRTPRATLGKGGSAFVFVRDCGHTRGAQEDGNPAVGLSFRHWGVGEDQALDVAELADLRTEGVASAGLSVEAAPGLYILAMMEPGGRVVEQPIQVSPGYQTQVFLTRERPSLDASEPAAAELTRASIVISAKGWFRPDDEQSRLAELARYALTHNRKILSRRLRDILCGELENPMLGLIGAHLMLRDEPGDAACIGAIAAQLTALLGADHPDVRALSLRTSVPAEGNEPITSPPMLKASWDLVVAASTRRPSVVAVRSPAAATATCALPGGPWLTWIGGPPQAQAARERAVTDIIADYVAARAQRLLAKGTIAQTLQTRPTTRSRPSNFDFFNQAGRFARSIPGFDAVAKSIEAPSPGASAWSAIDGLLPLAKAEFVRKLSVDEKADLSVALGLPSDALAALLEKVSG